MSVQSISKSEAATRQLHLAILLHFQDADVIGVHTLAGAAHGLLRDLLARSGDAPNASVRHAKAHRPQHKYVARMVHEAISFLKHADRDPQSMLRFSPGWTDFLIYDAIVMHIRLTHEITHPNAIFLLWVTSRYPTVLLFDDILGEGIAKLRRLFPHLGSSGTQKRTFLTALRMPNHAVDRTPVKRRRRFAVARRPGAGHSER
jgi:hypothetical protein